MTGDRAVVTDMVAALNEGDVDRFVSHYADDVTVRVMGSGEQMQGVDGVRAWIEDAFDALDGFSNDVTGMYGETGTIVLEVVADGVANREFAGRGPGEPFHAPELYVYELVRGKITAVRVYL